MKPVRQLILDDKAADPPLIAAPTSSEPRRKITVACKDCAFLSFDRFRCKHPKAISIDSITGEYYSFAAWMRQEDGECGPYAMLFKQASHSRWRKFWQRALC